MIARLVALLPVLVVSAALGQAADDWTAAGAVAAIGAVFVLVGPRFELDRGRQLVTSAMGAGLGYLVDTVLYEPHGRALDTGWSRFAAAAILAGAARYVIVRPSGGRMATMALLFAALVAASQRTGGGFGLFVALFVVAGVWLPSARIEYELLSALDARRLGASLGILALTGALATAGAVGVRRGYLWIVNRQRSVAVDFDPTIGFSDQMDLGSLDGLIDSDTVVLRVRGGHVDYLRGAVLDLYAAGRWSRSDRAEEATPERFDGPGGAAAGTVQVATVSASTDRLFLPLEARGVSVTPPAVLVDGGGALRGNAHRAPDTVRFSVGPRDRAVPAPPAATDLQLPVALRGRVAALAEEWTRGATTVAEKLDAIQLRLRSDFQYSRKVARLGGTDPAIEFLFEDRRGHCEYFATAMVLLARTEDIPARLVTGYRVGEESPFGYDIVRDRNAHAWVEAWVSDHWATYDPTPDAGVPQNEPHSSGYLAAIGDGLRVTYDDAVEWLQQRTVGETAVAWMAGLMVLFSIVARGIRRRDAKGGAPEDDAPLPCLDDLLTNLAKAGHPHAEHEPIERFAARLPDPEAARLLERCAALRYGSVGDAGALTSDVREYLRRRQKAT